MKIILWLIFLISTCFSQTVVIDNLHLDKTFKIVDEIMKRGDNLDELVTYLSDTTITTTNRGINEKNNLPTLVCNVQRLIKHIKLNKFLEGYTIESQVFNYHDSSKKIFSKSNEEIIIQELSFNIKLRSKSTKDIIWFIFGNDDGGNWKLSSFAFCNNVTLPDEDDPCDKN